jgi:NAD(P)H-hydrate epimerase
VKANITVTFAYPKTGLLEYPAIKYVGKLIVADIGIPLRKPRRLALPTGRRVAGFRQDYYMPQRKTWTHKGDYGKVLIIAGSRNMSGAAYLVSRAAIRSGAGLVYLAVPISIQKIVAPKTREVITYGLDETNEGTISLSALKQILQVKADVIAIGPGLGIQPYTRSLVKALIIKSKAKVLILDADALNAITDEVSILKKSRARVIITPHLGEFGRLINIKPAQIEQNREKYAKAFSRKYSVAVVLKGAYTMVVDKGRLSVNSSGNPGMATAGAGDVLTGIMAGFLAQGLSIPLAVYVHGLAGDLAARQKGQTSLIASDIIEKIPDAIQSIS